MPEKMTAFRLEQGLLDALDRAAEKLSEEHGGKFAPKWTRVDALRYFIRKGLEETGIREEEETAPDEPRKRGPAKARNGSSSRPKE